jgi:hypothetical protein
MCHRSIQVRGYCRNHDPASSQVEGLVADFSAFPRELRIWARNSIILKYKKLPSNFNDLLSLLTEWCTPMRIHKDVLKEKKEVEFEVLDAVAFNGPGRHWLSALTASLWNFALCTKLGVITESVIWGERIGRR